MTDKRLIATPQDTRLMKSAGTISISVALRSIVVALFGVVLMAMTSPLLSALTLGIASLPSLCHEWAPCWPNTYARLAMRACHRVIVTPCLHNREVVVHK